MFTQVQEILSLIPIKFKDTNIWSFLKQIAMPEFDTSHVKNIVLLGHAGSGKTTLAECMLYEAGIINRRGSIAEKNTTGSSWRISEFLKTNRIKFNFLLVKKERL